MEELNIIDHDIYLKETKMFKIDNRIIFISVFSGGIASMIAEIIYFPLDSIKTRIQASTNKIDFVEKTQKISKFRGISTIAMVSIPYAMVFFLIYDKIKQKISQKFNFNDTTIHIIGASFGEGIAGIVRNPFEVIKQQMQIGLNSTFLQTFSEIRRISGLKGFYAGYLPLILRDIPYSAIQFPIYEYLKKRTLEKNQSLPLLSSGLNGFVAGAIAAFFTTPIDVVKSKMMTQRDHYYKNGFHCFKTILKEDGIKGIFKGVQVRCSAIGFSCVIFFPIYERIKLIFDLVVPNF